MSRTAGDRGSSGVRRKHIGVSTAAIGEGWGQLEGRLLFRTGELRDVKALGLK